MESIGEERILRDDYLGFNPDEIDVFQNKGDKGGIVKHFWENSDIEKIDLSSPGYSGAEASEVDKFRRIFMLEYFRIKREITERYLVRLEPLVSLLLRGVDIWKEFRESQDPGLAMEWKRDVNGFLANEAYLRPVRNVAVVKERDRIPYYFGYTEDRENKEESFVLANGSLEYFLVFFDLIREYSKEWIVSEYLKKYEELEREFNKTGQPLISYVILIAKKFGPTGAISLKDVFGESAGRSRRLIRYEPAGLPFLSHQGQFSAMDGLDFSGFGNAGLACCAYDLIFSASGILDPLKVGQIDIERYSCIVLFYDRDFPRSDENNRLLGRLGRRIKTVYDFDELMDIIQKEDFSPLLNRTVKNYSMAGYNGNAKEKIPVGDYEEGLRDFAYETEGLNPTYLTCACYVGKKLFNLDIPDDFEPYGNLFVMSEFLAREIHRVGLRLTGGMIPEKAPESEETDFSTLRKLGSVFRGVAKEDVRLAAVYLMNGGIEGNFSEEKQKRAEEIIGSLRDKGARYFSQGSSL